MFPSSIIGQVLCSGAALSLICAVAPAFADSTRSGGALGQTTSAVDRATSSSSSGSGSSSGDSSYDSDYDYDYDSGYNYSGAYCPTCTYVSPGSPPGYARAPSRVRLAVGIGVQSVHDSDGAASIDARLVRDQLSFGIAGTRYYERGRAMDGSDTIHMDVWAVTLGLRAFDDGPTTVWLTGGLAGSDSNNFEASLTGGTVGVELQRQLGRYLAARGSARYFVLEQDMRASELRGALSASYFTLGYRVFRFNVGVPLHGPEVGLAFGF